MHVQQLTVSKQTQFVNVLLLKLAGIAAPCFQHSNRSSKKQASSAFRRMARESVFMKASTIQQRVGFLQIDLRMHTVLPY